MPISIHLFDVYRSSNIGIFIRSNDKFALIPRGLPPTKVEKVERLSPEQGAANINRWIKTNRTSDGDEQQGDRYSLAWRTMTK